MDIEVFDEDGDGVCETFNHEYYPIPQKIISGDFNGDGLTDVLSFSLPYSYQTGNNCFSELKKTPPCECDYESVNDSKDVFFVNLDRRQTTNFSNFSGQLEIDYKNHHRLEIGNFNGDSKSDLYHFSGGRLDVYSLDDNNTLVLLYTLEHPKILQYINQSGTSIDNYSPILLGDYNGDGLTDVMVPNIHTGGGGLNTDIWKIFTSTGKSFHLSTKTLP